MTKPIRALGAGMSALSRGWTRLLDRFLEHTDHHYRCRFPAHPGRLTRSLLRLFFRGIRTGPEQLQQVRTLPEDAVVVYVVKYKSHFEYLFYHTRYAQEDLPVPEIGFDYKVFLLQPASRILRIVVAHLRHFFRHWRFPDPYANGYLRSELLSGKAGLLSLVEPRGFYLRFVKSNPDPLRYLVEMQRTLDRPVFLVPQVLFYSKKPRRSRPTLVDMVFGSREKPGRLRRMFALFKTPESVFVEISEPVDLRDYMARESNADLTVGQIALKLRRQLLRQINRHRQSITGPLLKSQEELKENILTNDRLRGVMENYAETRNIPLYKVYKEADDYIDEIAAKYDLNAIQVMSLLLRVLILPMFEGISVNTEVLARVKAQSRRGPVVFVPCHKSHIDYLILSYLLFHNDMPCPHIAAGRNLSFWPLGPIFRRGGAFFIRRTFKGAVLYSKVFSEYVYKLLEEGFNIEFFIEGGRSRTGKLLQPKLGLLSILINAFRMGASDDLIFVPVYIGYDRVLEERAYLHELEGGQKKPENLAQVFRARKFLKRRYGRIYVQFQEGVSMKDLLERRDLNPEEMTTKEQNRLCREIGHRVVHAIDQATVITPHAVVAAAVLNTARSPLSHDRLLEDVETYMNYLDYRGAHLADTLTVDPATAVAYVIDTYLQRKFIERVPPEEGGEGEEGERRYTLNAGRRPALDYYKNNCISAFVPAAFAAMTILDRDAFQFASADIAPGYAELSHLFQNEFSDDPDKSPAIHVQENIQAFVNEAILIPHPSMADTYNLTSVGFRKLKLYARFLQTYLESYWIALHFFMRYPRDFVESKDRLKKIQSLGNRMFKKGDVALPESLSRITYRNALEFFTANGVKGSEDEAAIRGYADAIRRYRDRLSP
ncbi:MAG: 1-acyl-sn-glycerol-3-phosphate acyltransferase [Desulfococcaceae bacterium]